MHRQLKALLQHSENNAKKLGQQPKIYKEQEKHIAWTKGCGFKAISKEAIDED